MRPCSEVHLVDMREALEVAVNSSQREQKVGRVFGSTEEFRRKRGRNIMSGKDAEHQNNHVSVVLQNLLSLFSQNNLVATRRTLGWTEAFLSVMDQTFFIKIAVVFELLIVKCVPIGLD